MTVGVATSVRLAAVFYVAKRSSTKVLAFGEIYVYTFLITFNFKTASVLDILKDTATKWFKVRLQLVATYKHNSNKLISLKFTDFLIFALTVKEKT